ncbi:S8 family peptidase [Caldalkalibacillus salinus]|uniref:S8 family peptidase n=1 Tax=Caldalkalibacillus salinus TaxID=2803787 RepID=UPI00192440A5|nr:S8 family serine peptidase [Caldalkalibacillus salinus]
MNKNMNLAISIVLVVMLVFSLTPAATTFGQSTSQFETVVDPKLTETLAQTEEAVQVIVTFWGDEGVTEGQLNVLEDVNITTGFTFESLPIAGVLATKEQIEALATASEVRSLYLNSELEYFNEDSTDLTGVDKLREDPNYRFDGLPISGDGVTVLVNDSGVDGTHKDHEFGRKLVQNVMGTTNLNAYDRELLPVTYLEDQPNTDTNSGHGTHVAGTVAGTGAMSSGKYEGVAPGADLVGYGSGAVLFILDALGGFDYALTHQHEYDIRVVTNSWGSSGDFDPHNPINVATKLCYDRNMIITFAAGNSGPSADTHNPYAKAPWVISVAAGTKDGDLADFSSRGTEGHEESFELDGQTWTWQDRPTVTAPGVDVISTIPPSPLMPLGVSSEIDPAHQPYYAMMSGTSMATPHVAGIVALMLQANPSLTPDEVKDILQDTATDMPDYDAWEVGAGYVNAYDAVEKAYGMVTKEK